MRPFTAISTMTARTTLGRLRNRPVRKSKQSARVMEVKTRANGVFAPALSFTIDCERPPATGYPWPNDTARFAAPNPSSSCRASISFSCLSAIARAAEIPSMYASKKQAKAKGITPSTSRNRSDGKPKGGKP